MAATMTHIAAGLETFGDDEGVAVSRYHLATLSWITGDMAGFERSALEALRLARASGSTWLIGGAAEYVVLARVRGHTPLRTALGGLREVRASATFGIGVAAELDAGEAEILAYLGRPDEARVRIASAEADLTELGVPRVLAAIGASKGIIEDCAGDLEASEAVTRRAFDWFRANGDVGNGALVAYQLADVLARLGRAREAEELAAFASEVAPPFDVEAHAGSAMARARAEATTGRIDQGIATLAEAMRMLDRTDLLLLRADVLRTCGDVLAEAGRPAEAAERWRAALDAYRAKDHVVGERRVAASLARIGADQSP
jgi:tetratricopeptide (TPR) repeat protein